MKKRLQRLGSWVVRQASGTDGARRHLGLPGLQPRGGARAHGRVAVHLHARVAHPGGQEPRGRRPRGRRHQREAPRVAPVRLDVGLRAAQLRRASSASTRATSRCGCSRLARRRCCSSLSVAGVVAVPVGLDRQRRPRRATCSRSCSAACCSWPPIQVFALGVIADLIARPPDRVAAHARAGPADRARAGRRAVPLRARPGRRDRRASGASSDARRREEGRRAAAGRPRPAQVARRPPLPRGRRPGRAPRVAASRSRSVSVTSLHIHATLWLRPQLGEAVAGRGARGAPRSASHSSGDAGAGEGRAGEHRDLPARRASGAAGARRGARSLRRGSAAAARSPSALFTTMRSASSMIPRLMPCSSSPPAGEATSRNRSTRSATATSDWPTPTVSTITRSNPAASHSSMRLAGAPGDAAERARRRRRPDEGVGVPAEVGHPGLVAEDRSAGHGRSTGRRRAPRRGARPRWRGGRGPR